jgi:putative pyruvate formate lyase activating enzyme
LKQILWKNCQFGDGQEVYADELAFTMLSLERRGCHNINFVTPLHVTPQRSSKRS